MYGNDYPMVDFSGVSGNFQERVYFKNIYLLLYLERGGGGCLSFTIWALGHKFYSENLFLSI